MDIKVKSLYLKVSPRKVHPVMYSLRGQNPLQAKAKLNFVNKKGAKMLVDLLNSALAIAKENDLETDQLTIKSVYCNEGPRIKRRQVKARGRSDLIKKRMSHMTLVISDEVKNSKIKDKNDSVKSKKEKTL